MTEPALQYPDDADVYVVADRYPARITTPYGTTVDSRRVILTAPHGHEVAELVVFEARGADAVIVVRELWLPEHSEVPGDGQSAAPWTVTTPDGEYLISRGAGCSSCHPVLGGSFVPFHPYRMVAMPADLGAARDWGTP